MTVIPTTFNLDGSLVVTCDACSNTSPVATADINHPFAGAQGAHVIDLTCGSCGSSSSHPVQGGAAALAIQRMFIEKAARDGCPCGAVLAGASLSAASAHIQACVEQTDGAARWQNPI